MTIIDGKFRPTKSVIRDQVEESIRLVCRYFNYSPPQVWAMNCFEFLRDFNRALEMQKHELQTVKKWQNNK